jgi:hypothetical protein
VLGDFFHRLSWHRIEKIDPKRAVRSPDPGGRRDAGDGNGRSLITD